MGDIYFDSDYYGWFEQCLQCGHMHYLEIAASAGKRSRKIRPKEVSPSRNLQRKEDAATAVLWN